MSKKLCFSFHTSYRSVVVACYLQQKSIILYNTIALFACVRLWATPCSTGDAWNKGHATRGVHWPCAKLHASCMPPPNQEMKTLKHAAKYGHTTHCCSTRHVPRRVPRPCPCTTSVMKSRTKHNIYYQSRMQQRRRHRRHTAVAQGTYQGACLVHARAQQV